MVTVVSATRAVLVRDHGDWLAGYDRTTLPDPRRGWPLGTATNEEALAVDHGQFTGAVTAIVTVPACGPTVIPLGLTAYSHSDGSSASAASTLIRGNIRP